jgi:hypothetical protein
MSIEERFNARWIGEPNSGCWLWCGSVSSDGYGTFHADGKQRGAHRVAYELHCGKIPVGMHVCHRCDVPSCVNPSHLFLGTNQDNMRDKMKKGRWRGQSGEAHWSSKLSESDVGAIRASHLSGAEAARCFGVSRSLVSQIRLRQVWRIA